MGLREETRTIDGIDYRTVQFPAMRSLALMTRIAKVAGPGLESVTKLEDDGFRAIGAALGKLDGAEAQSLLLAILGNTSATVDGKIVELTSTAAIDTVFSERLGSIFKVARFALEVNYGDFLGGLLAKLGGQSAAPTESEAA